MSDLSPAALAVLDAYSSGFHHPVAVHHKPRIAATLRAAADQLQFADDYGTRLINADDLLAIATELENNG